MAEYLAKSEDLTAVADAIRAKGGTSETLVFPSGFVSAVEAIQAGGGGEDLLASKLEGTLTEYANSEITSVYERSFYFYKPLQSVSLPAVTNIGIEAFASCTNLTSINVPALLTPGTHCFRETAIDRIELPSVTSILGATFYKCASLVTLVLGNPDKVCNLNNANALTGTPIASGEGYIYVPSALLDSYKAATNWATYADQFRAIEDYPEICGEVAL